MIWAGYGQSPPHGIQGFLVSLWNQQGHYEKADGGVSSAPLLKRTQRQHPCVVLGSGTLLCIGMLEENFKDLVFDG